MPELALHAISLPGVMLQRGFWLYVWRIQAQGETMLYVGRTGDELGARDNSLGPLQKRGRAYGRIFN